MNEKIQFDEYFSENMKIAIDEKQKTLSEIEKFIINI